LPLLITNIHVGAPDSAGGANVNVNFINISNQPIKYALFDVIPYNRVGDVQRSDIGGYSKRTLENTGIFSPGRTNGYGRFERVWYNNGIWCMEITGITLVRMDDTEERYETNKIRNMFADGVPNRCR